MALTGSLEQHNFQKTPEFSAGNNYETEELVKIFEANSSFSPQALDNLSGYFANYPKVLLPHAFLNQIKLEPFPLRAFEEYAQAYQHQENYKSKLLQVFQFVKLLVFSLRNNDIAEGYVENLESGQPTLLQSLCLALQMYRDQHPNELLITWYINSLIPPEEAPGSMPSQTYDNTPLSGTAFFSDAGYLYQLDPGRQIESYNNRIKCKLVDFKGLDSQLLNLPSPSGKNFVGFYKHHQLTEVYEVSANSPEASVNANPEKNFKYFSSSGNPEYRYLLQQLYTQYSRKLLGANQSLRALDLVNEFLRNHAQENFLIPLNDLQSEHIHHYVFSAFVDHNLAILHKSGYFTEQTQKRCSIPEYLKEISLTGRVSAEFNENFLFAQNYQVISQIEKDFQSGINSLKPSEYVHFQTFITHLSSQEFNEFLRLYTQLQPPQNIQLLQSFFIAEAGESSSQVLFKCLQSCDSKQQSQLLACLSELSVKLHALEEEELGLFSPEARKQLDLNNLNKTIILKHIKLLREIAKTANPAQKTHLFERLFQLQVGDYADYAEVVMAKKQEILPSSIHVTSGSNLTKSQRQEILNIYSTSVEQYTSKAFQDYSKRTIEQYLAAPDCDFIYYTNESGNIVASLAVKTLPGTESWVGGFVVNEVFRRSKVALALLNKIKEIYTTRDLYFLAATEIPAYKAYIYFGAKQISVEPFQGDSNFLVAKLHFPASKIPKSLTAIGLETLH